MIAQAAPEVFTIHLPVFEGPFDLLLFFIERDELDIHDIPIHTITRDFLAYIHRMESMNIEVASEFILVAATLMKIKARMLLPRPKIDADGNVEDPRSELVNRLLEYKRYKEVLGQIQGMESVMLEQGKRTFGKKEEKLFLNEDSTEEELMGLDLYSIMRAFQRVWDRHQSHLAKPRHVIRRYPYTVDEVKASIMARLEEKEKVDFVSFVLDTPNKIFFVFSFLSLLELAQQQHLRLIIGKGYNNFWFARK